MGKRVLTILLILYSNIFSITPKPEYLFENFFGYKNYLIDYGIDLEMTYKSDYWGVLTEKIPGKDFYYIDLFEAIGAINSHKILGTDIGKINFHFLGINGQQPNDMLSTFQGFDNAEAENMWTIMNLYYDKSLFNEKLLLKFGLIDLNSQCDAKTTAGLFLNPSHGIGAEFSQAGINGPSIYPLTSLALTLDYKIFDDLYLTFGVFDAIRGSEENLSFNNFDFSNDDGLLFIYELSMLEGISMIESDCSINCEDGCEFCDMDDYSKTSLGVWYFTESMEHWFSNVVNFGIYTYFEEDIYIEKDTKNQGLAIYSKIGVAKDEVNPLSFFVGAGMQYVGLIPGRDKDQLGIGLSTGHFANIEQEKRRLIRELYSEFETNVEIIYNLRLNNYLSIMFDYQWFNQPADLEYKTSLNLLGARLFVNI